LRPTEAREIVLVRHAAASGQAPEAALTREGRNQARALAEVLAPLEIRRVLCSPFRRAIETAEPFCTRAGLEIALDARLAERVLTARELPDWREHLRRSFDELDYQLEDGESSRVAQARGVAVVREALAAQQRTLVVTHGNLLALILSWVDVTFGYEGWAKLANPDAFVVRVDGNGARAFRRLHPRESK
jgi:2,3-bisphosphoglycerate-dependent phosphoglycerate mutase